MKKGSKSHRADHAAVKSMPGAPCSKREKKDLHAYSPAHEKHLIQQQNELFKHLRREWVDCPEEDKV